MTTLHHQIPRNLLALLCLGIFLLCGLTQISDAQALERQAVTTSVAGELLVAFKQVTPKALRRSLRKQLRATVSATSASTGMEHWKLAAGADMQATIQQLQASGNVLYAEPNYRRYPRVIPTDPLFTQQWGLANTGQLINDANSDVGTVFNGKVGADMRLPTAWNTNTGSKAVIIAVIDDSVDINHPDLTANIWLNPREIAGDGLDNDLNGFVDDLHGWDFYANDADPSGVDIYSDGHGTAVAGCLGAVGNNGLGVAGVNWNVSIMALRMGFDVASEIAAIDYAIANGAHIVNISFGGGTFSQAEFNAFQRLQTAGILVVVAAGNTHLNNDIIPDYPSGFSFNNILSVAASTATDNLTAWSQYGATSVDLAAPGTSIQTTLRASTSASYANSVQNNLSYGFINGTSFSAPYVAGIAGLLKAQFPLATAQELKGRIMAAADLGNNQILSSRLGLSATGGRADAAASLTLVPQPVLVLQKVRVDDTATGNANLELDAGESVSLWLDLENVWQSAVTISATLSSLDPYVTLNNAVVTYPNILASSSAVSLTPFNITLSPTLQRHHRIAFALNITALNYNITRYFEIEVGQLSVDGVLIQDVMQLDEQDDSHIYHVQVPAGTTELQVATTSAVDIDLFAKLGSRPTRDGYTSISARNDGMERIHFLNPVAGTYYFEVYNFAQVNNTAYSIQAYIAGAAVGNSDVDGDTIKDALDAFPTDIAASVDSDFDGFPDVWTFGLSAFQSSTGLTRLDDFLMDPAASLDSDADQFPDRWNINATTAQIAASNLILDAYPNDPARALDITPPVVTAPLDLYVTLANATGLPAANPSVQAFFAQATAFDDVDAVLPVSPYNTLTLFPIGTTLVNFIATDQAGNAGFASSRVIVILDNVPPVVTVPANLTVAATDPYGTLATDPYVTVFLNAATALDNIDGIINQITHNSPGLLPAGSTNIVTFSASDVVGNIGVATATITVLPYVDTVAPVLTPPTSINVAAVTPLGTLATDPYITAFLNAATALDNLDGILTTITNNAPAAFNTGTTTAVTFTVADAAGNTSIASANVTVLTYIDTVPPVLTVPLNISTPALDPYGTLANDAALSPFFNRATAVDNVDGNLIVQNTAPIKFPIGATLVDFYASDLAGNQSLASATVTVLAFVDTIPPVIQVPAMLSVAATSVTGTLATHANITSFLNAATVTDNVTPNLTVANNAPSNFQVGTTQVDFYATDTAGNRGSAVGTVIVLAYIDTIVPSLTLPADVYVAATSVNGVPASDPSLAAFIAAATATDNVTPNILVSNNAPLIFPVGQTSVTFTTTDSSNNSTAGSALVHVAAYVDAIPPVVNAPLNIVVSADSVNGTPATLAVLQQVLNSATAKDNLDPVSVVTHNAPATFPVGQTLVTFSSTDSAGNIGRATNTITVRPFLAGALNTLVPVGSGLTFSQAIALGIDPYATTLDTDQDGVLDWVEIGNINNPTDTDADGIPDVLEAGNKAQDASLAASVRLITGTVDIYSAGQQLSQVKSAAIAGNAPSNSYSFPYGVIDYASTVSTPGQSIKVLLTFSTAFAAPLKLFKVDLAGNYVVLPNAAWKQINANTLELTLTDGDPQTDLDASINGIILDPIAVALNNIPVPVPVVGTSFISPPGQGCLLPVQTSHAMWFWLLAVLMMTCILMMRKYYG